MSNKPTLTDLEALVRLAVAVAGWPKEPVYTADEIREMLEDILANGSEADRRAIAVFLALVQEKRR